MKKGDRLLFRQSEEAAANSSFRRQDFWKSSLSPLPLATALLALVTAGCISISLFPQVMPLREKTVQGTAADKILMMDISGVISEKGSSNPLSESEDLVARIKEELTLAAEDSHIKALLLRINSPGGTVTASDVIHHEISELKTKRKIPVVATIMDIGASGGYYIAMAADAIVAQPGTLTGSIGVLGGKPVTASLLQRAGVSVDTVTEGRHADMFTTTRPFSDEEWARLNTWLDRIYADFTSKVADARGLSIDQVHDVARGRVWTGADAAGNGLVDQLGGLETAVALARRKAGLPDTAPLRLFPRTHPLDRLRPPESSEDRAAASASLLAESWGPVWRLAIGAGLPTFGPLQLPGHWVIH